MNHYVYKITDPKTRQFYIGVRSCKCDPEDDSYMGSYYTWEPEDKSRLQKEIIRDNFNSRKEANKYESKLIKENITNELNENYSYGVCINLLNKVVAKDKNTGQIKILNKEEFNNLDQYVGISYGRTFTKEHRDKIRETQLGDKNSFYGREFTEEHRKKISDGIKGEKNPMYGLKGENHPAYNHEGHRTKRKKVIHIESSKKFNSLKSASDYFGITVQAISYHCRRKAKNPKFKFID